MTAQAFALFGALTQAQQLRTWEIWHDPTEPTLFVYEVMGDQVVGRAAVTDDQPGATFSSQFQRPPAAPLKTDTVKSSRDDPKPISTRDVLHELPIAMKPGGQRNARPRLLISHSEMRTRQHSGRQANPKPRRPRSPYTRADVMRGMLLIIVLAAVWISAAH